MLSAETWKSGLRNLQAKRDFAHSSSSSSFFFVSPFLYGMPFIEKYMCMYIRFVYHIEMYMRSMFWLNVRELHWSNGTYLKLSANIYSQETFMIFAFRRRSLTSSQGLRTMGYREQCPPTPIFVSMMDAPSLSEPIILIHALFIHILIHFKWLMYSSTL